MLFSIILGVVLILNRHQSPPTSESAIASSSELPSSSPSLSPSTQDSTHIGDCSLDETGLKSSDVVALLGTYHNGDVKHLRWALDAYLTDPTSAYPYVRESRQMESNIKGGLDSFNKAYYRSQFSVFLSERSIGGGRNISILFRDKPDKIFNAWIYRLEGGDYELRGFWDVGYTEQEVKQIWQEYRYDCFIKDDRFWL